MSSLNSNSYKLIKKLIDLIPELKPIYDDHIDYYDELLEHVLFGEITRFAVKEFSENGHSECIVNLCGVLREALSSGDEQLSELITVSFLENLKGNGKASEAIKNLMKID